MPILDTLIPQKQEIKMYFLVYQQATDGDMVIRSFLYHKDIEPFILKNNLSVFDYAIFKGECIKSFS